MLMYAEFCGVSTSLLKKDDMMLMAIRIVPVPISIAPVGGEHGSVLPIS